MRGKKCKRVLSWLLCVCLMAGLIPVSAFAADTEQQSETTLTSQENTENDGQLTGQTEQNEIEQTEQNGETEQPTEQATDTTEESPAVSVQFGDSVNEEEENQEGKVATQAADGAAVTAVKLTETENGSVWGKGLITGSGDMDDKSWDGTEETRGYDSATDNNIIRSFDSITYNVSATFSSLTKGNTYTLVYEVTLPDDDELTLDDGKMNAIKPIECRKNENGTKTYICRYALEQDYAGGEKEENVIVKVGNKKQNDVIKPTIKAYLNENQSAALEVQNMQEVTVTSAPMYNIVLKKNTNLEIVKDVFDFSEGNSEGRTHYKDNAEGYKDYKVTGYRCIYGFALELRKPGVGIKGVELPDAAKDFTFDIDLSEATLNSKSLVDNGFGPLLFYLGPNEEGGGAVQEIPFSKYKKDKDGNQTGCLDSGNVSMTQEGTTLHVMVKNFKIDSTQFPKKNAAGVSYWEDLNKIREGIFSSYQFQVVYPYINKDGKVLSQELGEGTINVAASVSSMNATSTTGTKTTTETSMDDNRQTNSWNMTSGHKRNQEIFWSGRYENTRKLDAYSPNQRRNDGDIAAIGANDVGFTVAYGDTNVGAADDRGELPVAID